MTSTRRVDLTTDVIASGTIHAELQLPRRSSACRRRRVGRATSRRHRRRIRRLIFSVTFTGDNGDRRLRQQPAPVLGDVVRQLGVHHAGPRPYPVVWPSVSPHAADEPSAHALSTARPTAGSTEPSRRFGCGRRETRRSCSPGESKRGHGRRAGSASTASRSTTNGLYPTLKKYLDQTRTDANIFPGHRDRNLWRLRGGVPDARRGEHPCRTDGRRDR